jgi:hypothetical protein
MSGNSEGGRIARILENAQRCSIQENLARARAYQEKDSCVPCKSYNYLGNTNVPSESSYLASLTPATSAKVIPVLGSIYKRAFDFPIFIGFIPPPKPI